MPRQLGSTSADGSAFAATSRNRLQVWPRWPQPSKEKSVSDLRSSVVTSRLAAMMLPAQSMPSSFVDRCPRWAAKCSPTTRTSCAARWSSRAWVAATSLASHRARPVTVASDRLATASVATGSAVTGSQTGAPRHVQACRSRRQCSAPRTRMVCRATGAVPVPLVPPVDSVHRAPVSNPRSAAWRPVASPAHRARTYPSASVTVATQPPMPWASAAADPPIWV